MASQLDNLEHDSGLTATENPAGMPSSFVGAAASSAMSGWPGFPYRERILEDRVHGSLYRDERVFADEFKRIWQSTWIAVGHDSEVPNAGDYVLKQVAGQPMIMARGKDGQLRLLLNRCTHRANQVCDAPRGNATVFRCPYHGWTFANTGELRGYPYSGGYDGKLDKSKFGLGEAPRLDTYQGFVFASFAAEGPTLIEHLGAASGVLDRLASFSPEGRLSLQAGWLRHRVRANWKLLVDNETDGYHPGFVHNSIIAAADTPLTVYNERSAALVRDLGGGHTELDVRPEHLATDSIMAWCASSEERSREYVDAMRARHGRETADRLLVEGPPHVMIWPNLFISENFAMLIEPHSVTESVMYSTPLQFVGADALNRRIRRQFEGSAGPAGMLLADDGAMYERNQDGLAALDPEWVLLRRGLHRERQENGQRWSNVTDETSQRAIWRRYREAMMVDGEEMA